SAAHHYHALARGADLSPGCGRARRPSLLRGDPAVALIQIVHREVDAVELASRRVEVALDTRADRDYQCVVSGANLIRRDVPPHVGVVDELDSLLLEDLHAAVDEPFLELRVGY